MTIINLINLKDINQNFLLKKYPFDIYIFTYII